MHGVHNRCTITVKLSIKLAQPADFRLLVYKKNYASKKNQNMPLPNK